MNALTAANASNGRHVFLACLGAGRYEDAHYVPLRAGDSSAASPPTRFIQVARLADLLLAEPDRVLDVRIFATDKAASTHWDSSDDRYGLREDLEFLGAEHGDRLRTIERIRVPDGACEDELYELFELVAGCIEEGDHLYVDVTHGFRIQPIVLLLALDYVARVKNATIEEVTYGAWDAREPQTKPGSHMPAGPPEEEPDPTAPPTAPTFDLTPMLELRRWSAALSHFQFSGDLCALGREINASVRKVRGRLRQDMSESLAILGGGLRKLGDHLEHNRLRAGGAQRSPVAQAADSIVHAIRKARLELPGNAETRFFAEIAEKIAGDLKPLAVGEEASPDALIDSQLAIVEYHLRFGRHVLAFTVLREASYELAAHLAVRAGASTQHDRDDVDSLGGFLPAAAAGTEPREGTTTWGREAAALLLSTGGAHARELAKALHVLSNLRNNLDHCGTQDAVSETATLQKRGEELVRCFKRLKSLSLPQQSPPTGIGPTAPPAPNARALLVLLNHELSAPQERDARANHGVTAIELAPPALQAFWSQIAPEGDLPHDVVDDAYMWFGKTGRPGDLALVQGEPGATFAVVSRLLDSQLVPVYATGRRDARDESLPDGSIRTVRTFSHVAFRRYCV